MKLHELKSSGTYVAVVPTPATWALLEAWAAENGVQLDQKLHTTLLFSRKVVGVELSKDEHHGMFTGFEVFRDKVVALLDAPSMIARHEQFIAQGGTHDYPDFQPHISLFDGNMGYGELKPIDFGMILGMEYSEPLDL